jgi:vitamin B12 transporter
VITAEDIKKSGVTTVAELLTMQEGIYVVGAGQNPGMTSSIFTRGANSNQTIIMIDGIRITDPSAINNSIDVSELSLANISKIEIVRGSHSTLYGSSAIGGVVNILTRSSDKPGLTVDAALLGGTFGEGTSEISENIHVNYKTKNGLYAGAEIYNSNIQGLNATVDTVTDPAVYKHSDRSDDFDKLDWLVKAGFKNAKLDIYASYKKTKQLTEIDRGAYRDDDNFTVDFTRDLITYGANYKVNNDINVSYIGGYTAMKRIATDDSSRIDNAGNSDLTYNIGVYEGAVLSNELQANYKRKGLNVVLGGGMYNESMNINTRYNSAFYNDTTSLDSLKPKASTSNIFLHTDIGGDIVNDRFKWFNLALGARFSGHSIFGSNLTYEINPSFRIGETGLLYYTFSTGYNAPSLYQLYDATRYYTWDTQFTTGLTRGNRNLDPETSTTNEIGFKQKINNVYLSASYFHTVVENVIEYVYLWDKNVPVNTLGTGFSDDFRGDTYLNAGTMITDGVELGISSKLSDKFIVSGNVMLMNGKLKYSPENIDVSQTGGNHVQMYNAGAFLNKDVKVLGLSRRPSTANLSLTYFPIKVVSLRADLRYVGSRGDVYYESSLGPYGALGTVSVQQYTLLDLSLNFKIWKGLSAGFKVGNITDEKYAEINGFTTKGRSYYLNIRYSL